MKITCQSCQSKYTVSDEKVQGKTVKIKCRKCGATILVNSGGVTTSAAGVTDADSLSAAGPDGGQTFQVNVGDGDQRSMSVAEIVAAYNSSVITAETYVWADGMGDWAPLGQVESIVAALNSPAAAAAPAPAAYAPPAASYAPPAAAYAPPAAAYAPPAAAYAPPAAAYAPPEPVAEAPRAAARRDPARRAPDLFGAGGGGMGQQSVEEVATSAPHYNGSSGASPMGRGAPAPGGREENSMLFSLSALTAKAATSAGSSPGSKTSAGNHEDSGVIDLKALANSAGSAQQHGGGSDLMPEHGGLFPLGAPPIASSAGSPMAMPTIPPPAASKAPIFIGVGIAVATLAIVGAFFVMKSGGEKPAAPIESVAVVAPPPPPTVEVAPPPTAVVEASAAPTSSAVAKVAPKGGGGRGGAVAPKGGSGAPTPPAGGGGTTAPPPVKKSSCGCAPSDLMCAMKCSAK